MAKESKQDLQSRIARLVRERDNQTGRLQRQHDVIETLKRQVSAYEDVINHWADELAHLRDVAACELDEVPQQLRDVVSALVNKVNEHRRAAEKSDDEAVRALSDRLQEIVASTGLVTGMGPTTAVSDLAAAYKESRREIEALKSQLRDRAVAQEAWTAEIQEIAGSVLDVTSNDPIATVRLLASSVESLEAWSGRILDIVTAAGIDASDGPIGAVRNLVAAYEEHRDLATQLESAARRLLGARNDLEPRALNAERALDQVGAVLDSYLATVVTDDGPWSDDPEPMQVPSSDQVHAYIDEFMASQHEPTEVVHPDEWGRRAEEAFRKIKDEPLRPGTASMPPSQYGKWATHLDPTLIANEGTHPSEPVIESDGSVEASEVSFEATEGTGPQVGEIIDHPDGERLRITEVAEDGSWYRVEPIETRFEQPVNGPWETLPEPDGLPERPLFVPGTFARLLGLDPTDTERTPPEVAKGDIVHDIYGEAWTVEHVSVEDGVAMATRPGPGPSEAPLIGTFRLDGAFEDPTKEEHETTETDPSWLRQRICEIFDVSESLMEAMEAIQKTQDAEKDGQVTEFIDHIQELRDHLSRSFGLDPEEDDEPGPDWEYADSVPEGEEERPWWEPQHDDEQHPTVNHVGYRCRTLAGRTGVITSIGSYGWATVRIDGEADTNIVTRLHTLVLISELPV